MHFYLTEKGKLFRKDRTQSYGPHHGAAGLPVEKIYPIMVSAALLKEDIPLKRVNLKQNLQNQKQNLWN